MATDSSISARDTGNGRAILWAVGIWLCHGFTGVLVLLGLVALIPRYEELFNQADLELPPMSMLVIVMSNIAVKYWYLAAPLAVVYAIVLFVARRALPSWLTTAWAYGYLLASLCFMFFAQFVLTMPLVRLMNQFEFIHKSR